MSPIKQMPLHRLFVPGHRGATLSALAAIAFLVLVNCAPQHRPVGPTTNDEKRAKIEAMYEEFRPDFPDAEEIDVEGFLKLQARGEVLLVDVREDKERAISTIPGSISKADFEELGDDLIDVFTRTILKEVSCPGYTRDSTSWIRKATRRNAFTSTASVGTFCRKDTRRCGRS